MKLDASAGDGLMIASLTGSIKGGGSNAVGGAISVNFRTNVNGAALAASVPPAVDTDLGQLIAPGSPIGPFALEAYQVVWARVELCRDAADPAHYFDLDMSPTSALYSELMVFDSNGNMVARDIDSGPGALSQLSFGQVAPARPPTGDATTRS